MGVYDNLPELAPERAASTAVGEPVAWEHLVELVGHLNPDDEYPLWRDHIAAIHATNAGTEKQRYDLAQEWSAKGSTRYDGPDPVARVWATMPPKEGGVGYGTLLAHGRIAGYTGASAAAPEPVDIAEEFGAYVAPKPSGKWERAADIISEPDEPLEELVEGLIEKGIATQFAGPGGAFKSRIALQWGIAIENGVPIFGHKVHPATFVYLSWEDPRPRVKDRLKVLAKRLELPMGNAIVRDLVNRGAPFATIGDTFQEDPFYTETVDFLKTIHGHKFVVLDSAYDALKFQGNNKNSENPVVDGLALLQQLCDDANATVLYLWHPSQSGAEKGDMSGFSGAWVNKPRARLSVTPVKDLEGAVQLKVEKRNYAKKPRDPITLHYSDGAMLPLSETATKEQKTAFTDACIAIAIAAAEQGAPITHQRKCATWMIQEVDLRAGQRPDDRAIKEELAKAVRDGVLIYVKGSRNTAAGYYARTAPTTGTEASEAEA